MKKLIIACAVLFGFLVSGCSINHPVAKDYDAHLEKYGDETSLPNSGFDSEYNIASETQGHRYQFRSATVGYAHVWIVEFGKILDKTLNSEYVQSAFGRLSKISTDSPTGDNLIEFELVNYEFKNYRAYTSLNIEVTNAGQKLLNKTYTSEGVSKGGQMWAAGPFGMKNATLASTKSSIDKILQEFLEDLRANKISKN
jgi:hypothetical protein